MPQKDAQIGQNELRQTIQKDEHLRKGEATEFNLER